MSRHNALRDALFEWLRLSDLAPRREVHVPAWDRPEGERAILDVQYRHPNTQALCYLDVSVVAAATRCPHRAETLLKRREGIKHLRYPGELLTPFVVDVRGAWGVEAVRWGKDLLKFLPCEDKAAHLWRLRWFVAKALHLSISDQVHSCHFGPKGYRG